MRIGVHLPLIGWPGTDPSPASPLDVAVHAEAAGFATIAANDHLVYQRPWLDGLAALAAAAARTSTAGLMTSVALPVVRGPFALAKALAAIDRMSGGRLDAGIGPGSSRRDYGLAGIPFDERWPRFDEAAQTLRTLLRPGSPAFVGRFYSSEGTRLEPPPARPDGPRLWIGSWGSEAGIRRVARLADGWLASAYNTTPADVRATRLRLDELTDGMGRTPLPCRVATAFLALTTDAAEARRLIEARLVPVLQRPIEDLAPRLLVGPEGVVADRLTAYAEAGVEQVLVWPIVDEVAQLDRLAERVIPAID